jgi:3-oxoadipate enol-lactonase
MRMFDGGSGPPLILIPGVQGRWEWLRPALRELQLRCRTISYSLCGDFRSHCTFDRSRGFDNYLEQLDDIFTAARLERAALCGISYGGFIALRYAATRPDRVSALIIASSPAPGWKPSAIQSAYISSPLRGTPKFVLTSPLRVWPEIRTAFDRPVDRLAFLAAYGLRAAAAPMNPPLMASRIVEQQQMDFCPDCAHVKAPTLVVSGEPHLDRIVPVESTRHYADLIPGARYVQIERTGHLGLVTRPAKFASIVGDFVLGSASPQRSAPPRAAFGFRL